MCIRDSGLVPVVAGCEWEWFRIIHRDDTITVVDIPTDILDKTKETGPRRILQIGNRIYRNQRDEVVCVSKRITMNIEGVERVVAKMRANSAEVGRYKYSSDEIQAIDQAYEGEEIRGSDPRYWDDVALNEELKPVVKGPLTHGDMVAFLIGTGFMDEAHGLSRSIFKKYPNWAFTDPNTGVTEWGWGVHLVDFIARTTGAPIPIAFGVQACCWLGHLITNWMGDDGFLKKLSMQMSRAIPHGDTTWCKGKVGKKYIEDGKHLVDCEIWGENQVGTISTLGHATVVLPARADVS